jgi:hypothetical protein
MDDIDLKMRGEKPMSEEDALLEAIDEATPMIVFWHTALAKFGPACRDVVREQFSHDLWEIAGRNARHPDVQTEIYHELFNYSLTENSK